jgi:hypothetical protein
MKIAKFLFLALLLTACEGGAQTAVESEAETTYENYQNDTYKFSLDTPVGWETSFDDAEGGFTLTMLSPIEGETDLLQEQIEFVDASSFQLPQDDLTELRAGIKEVLVDKAGFNFIEESEYKFGAYDGGLITADKPDSETKDTVTYVVTTHDGKAYYIYMYYLESSEFQYMPILEHVVASFKWL